MCKPGSHGGQKISPGSRVIVGGLRYDVGAGN